MTVASTARDTDVLAAMHNLSMEEVDTRLAAARRKLFKVREGRAKPGRDEKVLTGWNGLMLAAFAEAARVLKREDYRAIAERNADFILHELRDHPEGRGSAAHDHPERTLSGAQAETKRESKDERNDPAGGGRP